MSLDSLEESIQNLLSVLYPPFEATAPTLLSQLFKVIDSRYQGDALRCLLDFLVPAKHILDTVQQAACAQYSDVLFLCEGWPLCLRDQVVIHLAPIDPLLLQPGDFYLQVTPFCDQSARIVVCSLLEEYLRLEVVEETPIPETSYPCIFSCDWLEKLNHGRYGTSLSHCLLATQQGILRLPWEQVAVPEFVDPPQIAVNSMASVPPSYPSLQPQLPRSPVLSPEDSSSNCLFPLCSSKKTSPTTIQNSSLPSSSEPPVLSVETRICPAKHGIAVSLCLVDASSASSSRLQRVKEAKTEQRPIGWVSPTTWDSRFTETNPKTTAKANKGSNINTASRISDSTNCCKIAERCVSKNSVCDRNNDTNPKNTRRVKPEGQVAAEGEYIDILQATLLFGRARSQTEEQQKLDMHMQSQTQMETQVQRQVHAHTPHHAQTCLPAKPQMHHHCRSDNVIWSRSSVTTETGPASAPHHVPPLHPSQCVCTVGLSEKPCTPCMKRRQGEKVSRAQELRCRFRESYQAALQNPVKFEQEKVREKIRCVVEEDTDDGLRKPGPETRDPRIYAQGRDCDTGMKSESPSCVTGTICQESGEKVTVPYWTPDDTTIVPCAETRGSNTANDHGKPELATNQRATASFRKPAVEHNENSHLNLQNVAETNVSLRIRGNTDRAPSSPNEPKESGSINNHHGVLYSCRDIPDKNTSAPRSRESPQNRSSSGGSSPNVSKPHSLSPNRWDAMLDGRCSSLSTAVVETSEKCDLVLVEGQNVRRQENADSCAEIPQLHVVKCKKSTAFRLVSPKINRRKAGCTDISQPGGRFCHQMENQSQPVLPSAIETKRNPLPQSSQPRPDHLPLGSSDPQAHPLYQGVAALTGGKDRTGRAIIEVYGDHQGWRSNVTSQELCHMLLYFHSIIRREIREAGMTLIYDARRTNPQPQLYKALMTLQEQTPQAVNSFVVLVEKDSGLRPEPCPGIQTEVLTSMKALLKVAEESQRSVRLDGTLPQSHWTELHQKLFPFASDLHEASSLLLGAISRSEEPQRTDTVQAVQQSMVDQRTLMHNVLEDNRLVNLQREGGAILARLRKESDLRYPYCGDLSDAVDSLTSLYNHVEEQVHVLVQKSNMSLEHLQYLLQLREMEGIFMQVQQWFTVVGECHLLEAESVEASGERMEQILNSFTAFLIEANDRQHHAMSLVSDAQMLQQTGLSYPETEAFRARTHNFKSGLEDFLSRAEACGHELQIMVSVCDFCEQATALARECIEYLDKIQPKINITHGCSHGPTPTANNQLVQQQNHESGAKTASLSLSDIPAALGSDSSILQVFQDKFLQFSLERFQEVKAQASTLRGSRGMRVWNMAWLKCQEARQQLQERLQDEVNCGQSHCSSWCESHYIDVVSTNVHKASPGGQTLVVQSNPGPQHPQWEAIVSGDVDFGKRSVLGNNSVNPTAGGSVNVSMSHKECGEAGTSQGSKTRPQSSHRSSRRTEREMRRRQANRTRSERDSAALSQSHTIGCQWFPWGRGLGARSMSQDSCSTSFRETQTSSPPEQANAPPSSCYHHGQPSCRILQEAQKFQISRHGSFCSDDSCLINTSNRASFCKHSSLPVGKYEGDFCLASPQESASRSLRLQRVLEELLFTEREYVRSLGYILTHYFPLLDRQDIPQDLRGKRGIIFGNLEKLHDFHSHYFLPELEASQREPAMVARCFLRHTERFGLYSLYSKNKPESDALILHRRHDIFKKKQQELGDMMDLSSYLLRPIQRISKYTLLLQDMLTLSVSSRPKDLNQDPTFPISTKPCPGVCVPDLTGSERERELADMQAAADLVRFQMRHGNDLLTMDAIRDCDVNLKEQGKLIRQDEFTVFFRKKKCVRRIFLFEDLILFSKTKKTDIGNDVYIYKQSFKTSDIGMTHNSGVSGLCFEIWFRRRKSSDTYTLKASNLEMKKAWTTDLERILWDQATHSRELRMQERVFMGMGCKPFMDIQPSDAAICDRAVNFAPPGRIPLACCSHRSLEFPRPHSIGSGSTASTNLSQSSSSSGRGSLPPAGHTGNQSQGGEPYLAVRSIAEAVTDNELNNQHLPHHNCEGWKTANNPLLSSTESSREAINLHSNSDGDRLSALGGEANDSSSSFISQSSKLHPQVCQTPSLRVSGIPSFADSKPAVPPKPPHLTHPQESESLIGKSTEV